MKVLKPIILRESAAPSTPPSGHVALYSVDGSALLMKDDAGNIVTMAGGTPISGLTAASTLDGTEEIPLVQGGTTKKATVADIRVIDITKVVAANRTSTATAYAAISDFTTSLVAGTYAIRTWLCWQTAATTTGIGFRTFANGGTVTMNVGHVYTTTTGTNATTGVADQATGAGNNQMIESHAWRANNVDPGAFAGVDTANADQFAMLEALLVVTATTSLEVQFASEVAASQVTVRAGSYMSIQKAA